MSDRDRLLEALREAGPRGVHTFDVRKLGISGNPSQRKAELEAEGHEIVVEREKRGERWGARYTLARDANRVLTLILDYTGEEPVRQVEWRRPLPPRKRDLAEAA